MAGACCLRGAIHLGTPTGHIETIHGLQTYVAEPPAGTVPKGIIIYIPDAFGWSFVNNRLLCDRYASNGNFLVYLPDFMNGSSVKVNTLLTMDKIYHPRSWIDKLLLPVNGFRVGFSFLPFIVACRSAVTSPRIIRFIHAIRSAPPPFETKALKIGCAGFCWGGKHAFILASDPPLPITSDKSFTSSSPPTPLINCAFSAHPSFLSIPHDITAVKPYVPLLLSIGDNDVQTPARALAQIQDILEKDQRGNHRVIVMPGAEHGFAIRTRLNDEFMRECAERAEKQAIDWFTQWMT
ncbi:hypothetical protein K3495_g1751 [Podosphaera aphanis]|nr:hypothetical protein K3495_g1751 [Podosphaera aphanis]